MAAHPTSLASSPHPSKHARSPSPSEHVSLAETPVQPENQPKNRFPPVIVRDFVGLPRPPLLSRPIDKEWVVDLQMPPSAVPGLLARKSKEWEESHAHLYRTGNRADPPNTIPKTWGGLPKAEDDEMMRRAKASRPRPLELTRTEPDLGVIFQNSVMTDEERGAHMEVKAFIRKKIEMVQMASQEPLIDTPPNTPPPLNTPHPLKRQNAMIFVPSSPPTTLRTLSPVRPSEQRTKRKREESDNEYAHSNAARSKKRTSRRPRSPKQDGHEAATDTTPRYWLRRHTVSSSPQTSSTKHVGCSKGKKSGP